MLSNISNGFCKENTLLLPIKSENNKFSDKIVCTLTCIARWDCEGRRRRFWPQACPSPTPGGRMAAFLRHGKTPSTSWWWNLVACDPKSGGEEFRKMMFCNKTIG